MSASYKTLTTDRQWKATTGLSKKKFRELKKHFGVSFKELFDQELWERQSNSTTETHLKSYGDYLFFILFSLKSGLTYDALGFVFGMSGGNAVKVQREGVRILNLALMRLSVMPKRVFEDVKAFESTIAKDEAIKIDGTEQPVQRPGNQQDQKDQYSGKKKTHCQVDRDKQ